MIEINRAINSPSYNIAPTDPISVITKENPLVMSTMRWGFVPEQLQYYDSSKAHINARSERLLELKMYEPAFKSKRCLIPANGFYEWKAPVKVGENKVPYYIKIKDEESFTFAGIYSNKSPMDRFIKSTDKTGLITQSCAILTTKSNDFLAPIHDRMPVILSRESETVWLDPQSDLNVLFKLFEPYPGRLMEAFPVSNFVNSPKNNSEKCIEKIDEEELRREQLGIEKDQFTLDDFF